MMRLAFNVEAIAELKIEADQPIKDRDLMSPYVWKDEGGFKMLVRSAPRTLTETGNTGAIHYGESDDGLEFRLHAKPVLQPDGDDLDIGGCEDPTVIIWRGEYIVYYTGVDRSRSSGQMLYATGERLDQLQKRGVALASSKTEGNTKEATVEHAEDGKWRLFYEYARNEASLIGLALGEGVAGPWAEQKAPFAPRDDNWDNWHLSPGPMLTSDKDTPVMFYNGATHDARWRIGWIAFNRDYSQVVDRCIEPLIVPPPPKKRDDTDIAFAASCIAVDDVTSHLYFSRADKTLFRAEIRRS
jgi:beta-1,2-mannobiose phosphorylase / 1,2-beta-oligomannan phosphorylase